MASGRKRLCIHIPFAESDAVLVKWRPAVSATALFLLLLTLIRPWSELPVNDDWQYAHVAKNFAATGRLTVDVPVAPTLVGQTLMALPVIRTFGFSHLALRSFTLALSILILFELGYLLSYAAVPEKLQFVALANVVANPLFLHFSTSFMTENYGYLVALLGACIWFYGRERHPPGARVLAALVIGFAFWIRQFSALVLPALILAELIHSGSRATRIRQAMRDWVLPLGVLAVSVAAYFLWARATGNYNRQFSYALSRVLTPDPLILVVDLGIFLFYMTFFFAPFLVAFVRRERVTLKVMLIPALLVMTAGFAWHFGDWSGSPRTNLRPTFPFLHNVFNAYGVGPITLTDVYWRSAPTRPSSPIAPWIVLEIVTILVALGWARVISAAREAKNEVAVFGICLSLLSFLAVALSSQLAVFDRYHYPGILGLTLAVAAVLPLANKRRLFRAAFVWIGALAIFSTLSLHDYFRWNEVRAQLVRDAQKRGIALSQLDGGYEVNGWNDVEGLAVSEDCGTRTVWVWFCDVRAFRIGLEQKPSDSVILSRAVNAWFVHFPDLKLMTRRY